MPKLTSGFSTAAESDIRTGAGKNQVQYNINAPVSIDGGDGFDKLVILGTEFADHIVVTVEGDLRRRPLGHVRERRGARDRRARGRRHDRRPLDRAGRRDARHRRPRQRHDQRRRRRRRATSSRATSRARAARSTTTSPRPTRSTTASSPTASTSASRAPARAGRHHRERRLHRGLRGRLLRPRPDPCCRSARCRCRRSTRTPSQLAAQPDCGAGVAGADCKVYVTVSAAYPPDSEHPSLTRPVPGRPAGRQRRRHVPRLDDALAAARAADFYRQITLNGVPTAGLEALDRARLRRDELEDARRPSTSTRSTTRAPRARASSPRATR